MSNRWNQGSNQSGNLTEEFREEDNREIPAGSSGNIQLRNKAILCRETGERMLKEKS